MDRRIFRSFTIVFRIAENIKLNIFRAREEFEGREIEDVLLIFYKDEPFEVEQEGFTTINIKYELTLGLYTKLE